MTIGRLDKRITIEVLTFNTDPGGGVTETWAADADVTPDGKTWAEVKPLRASRNSQDNQIGLLEAYVIHLRWAINRDLNKKHRIIFGTKILTITGAIVIDEAKRFWEINAIVKE